jgi:predicted RNase H-like HicB family nuclease
MKLLIVLERDEDGYLIASCPIFPGCHSQGKTKEEAIANISEAIRGYIASMRKHGEKLPDMDIEELEVTVNCQAANPIASLILDMPHV